MGDMQIKSEDLKDLRDSAKELSHAIESTFPTDKKILDWLEKNTIGILYYDSKNDKKLIVHKTNLTIREAIIGAMKS